VFAKAIHSPVTYRLGTKLAPVAEIRERASLFGEARVPAETTPNS
jgi:hypothetical protein